MPENKQEKSNILNQWNKQKSKTEKTTTTDQWRELMLETEEALVSDKDTWLGFGAIGSGQRCWHGNLFQNLPRTFHVTLWGFVWSDYDKKSTQSYFVIRVLEFYKNIFE